MCSILCSAGNCWEDDGSEIFFGTILGGDKWYEDGEIWESKVGERVMSCFQGKLLVSDCWSGGGGAGGEGYSTKFYTDRVLREVQSITLSCTTFDRKGRCLVYLQ